jgi:hypothetical protein
MIWALLDALENPHLWAVHTDDAGIIHLAPVDVLKEAGRTVRGTTKDGQ